MRCLLFFVVVAGMLQADLVVQAGPPVAGRDYPRVYGPTGKPYGPTQANYQYQRQYGRSWTGSRGLTTGATINNNIMVPNPLSWNYTLAPFTYGRGYHNRRHCNRYPYYYGSPYAAYPYYWGPSFGVVGVSSQVIPNTVYWIGSNLTPGYGYHSGLTVPQGGVSVGISSNYSAAKPSLGPEETVSRYIAKPPAGKTTNAKTESIQPLIADFSTGVAKRYVAPSSTEKVLESLQWQAEGDVAFRKGDYSTADRYYGEAAVIAPDRGEPHFRSAVALAADEKFTLAVRAFQRGLLLDPDWPRHGESLQEMFGKERLQAKLLCLASAAQWVEKSPRDADRIFLLAALLHLDRQEANAREWFEEAAQIAGMKDHIRAFLVQNELSPELGVGTLKPVEAMTAADDVKTVKQVERIEPVERIEKPFSSAQGVDMPPLPKRFPQLNPNPASMTNEPVSGPRFPE